ncbi:phage tail spike protein [Sporolactobacillus terrae]|uniref:phage tail spike protein n=1 Tax=Sporolactobacillus terrae TaxID=269673 RepID=UPI000491E612|nr:phage tail spike protein [Sporolactobacillus terrae]
MSILILHTLSGETDPLTDFDDFRRTRQVNGDYMISFTIDRTERNAEQFDRLVNKNKIELDGDVFVIDDVERDPQGGVTKEITARHEMFDRLYAHHVDEVYTAQKPLKDWIDIVLNGTGLTAIIDGNFGSEQFDNFGDAQSLDMFKDLIDRFGVEYKVSGLVIRIQKQIGVQRDAQFRHGHNLKTFSDEYNTDNLVTQVTAKGKNDDDGNPIVSVTVKSPNWDKFERVYAISAQDERFTNEDSLRAYAESKLHEGSYGARVALEELYKNGLPVYQYDVGDFVWCIYDKDGMDLDLSVRISAQTDNPFNPAESPVVDLGDARYDITKSIADNNKEIGQKVDDQKTFFQDAIDHATDMITGNLGGHVIFRPKDKPQELLIMDTDDVDTAQKVWRWNLSGLGYSSTGVNGPYGLAMTADGAIVADFITAGVLRGILVEGTDIHMFSEDKTFDARLNSNGLLMKKNGQPVFSVDANGNVKTYGAQIEGGSIHLINNAKDFEATFDGDGLKLYKNGNPIFTVDADGNLNTYGASIHGGSIEGSSLHVKKDGMDIWLDLNGFHMKKDDFDVWIDGNGIRAIKGGQEKIRIAQDGTVSFYDANIIGKHIKITPETIEISGSADETDKTILREGGLHFYKDNSYLGNLVPVYSGLNSQKGISLNLGNADFLSFDEPGGSGKYKPMFEALKVPVDGKQRGIHGYLPFDMHNNPIKDNMGAYVNVVAYGADPTGTKMSADAIQKALDKCRYVGSGTVYLPTGTYKLEKTLYIYASTKLLLDDNARMIRCHTMSCMLVNGGQNGEFADVTGYDGPGGIEIIGGYWDNNLGDSQYQDNQNDMFILGHGANIWVEKVKFIDCISYHCIDMNGCCHVRIRDCGFFGYHDYTTEGVAREAIQIGECNFAEFGVNDFTPCFDVIVEGCLFTKSSKQGYFPAGVGNHYSRNGVRQTDIVVRNNYFEGCTHSGTHPYKWGTTWIYQNTYINCKRAVHCSNVNGGDVSAQNPDGSPSGQPGACENIYIFDNDMINCQSDNVYTSGFIYNGIYAQPRNIVIERNRITGTSGNTGLSLTLVQDTKIRKNAFKFLYRGIWLNSCDKTEVDDNTFESIERECVAADLDSNQTEFNNRFLFVRRNRMFNIGYSAVYMRTTWHGSVSDNEMFDVASSGGARGGVAVESSDSIRVLNNSIDVKLNGSDQFSISIGHGSTGCQSSNNRINVKQVVDPNGGNFIGRFGVDGNGNPVKIPDMV